MERARSHAIHADGGAGLESSADAPCAPSTCSQMPARLHRLRPIDSRRRRTIPVGVEPGGGHDRHDSGGPSAPGSSSAPVQGRRIHAKVTAGDYDTGTGVRSQAHRWPESPRSERSPIDDGGCGAPDAILPRIRQRPGSRGEERRECCLGAARR